MSDSDVDAETLNDILRDDDSDGDTNVQGLTVDTILNSDDDSDDEFTASVARQTSWNPKALQQAVMAAALPVSAPNQPLSTSHVAPTVTSTVPATKATPTPVKAPATQVYDSVSDDDDAPTYVLRLHICLRLCSMRLQHAYRVAFVFESSGTRNC